MLNQSGVIVTNVGNVNQILEDDKVFFSMSCMVAATGVTADASGKKIVKAGTPISGSLQARETAFTVGGETPVGLLLNDVDATGGTANGTVLVFGFVNLNRMDTATAALAKAADSKLPLITMVK